MKYFLLGVAVWFALTWFPQFIKAWFIGIRYRRAKKRVDSDDKWAYEV